MVKSKQTVQSQVSSSKQGSSSKTKMKPAAAAGASTSSSIDDIFAKPSKPTAQAQTVSAKAAGKAKASTATSEPSEKTAKKAKISKPTSRAVETVLDPSAAAVPAPVEASKPKLKKRDRAELDEEEAFRDSRGEGPSTCIDTRAGVSAD